MTWVVAFFGIAILWLGILGLVRPMADKAIARVRSRLVSGGRFGVFLVYGTL